MLDEKVFSRQLDIISPENLQKEILIIGTGGVGSVTALTLAKIGCSNLKLIDDDKVAIHNIPSQFFAPSQSGKPKVEAISETLEHFMEVKPEIINEKWSDETAPIMILAVDSMATRKEIYESLKGNFMVERMIEARMSAEKMRIYSIIPSDEDDQRKYEKTLYTDEEASEEKCTAKAIAYNTFIIGGLITSIVKKHLANEEMIFELIFNLEDYSFYVG